MSEIAWIVILLKARKNAANKSVNNGNFHVYLKLEL